MDTAVFKMLLARYMKMIYSSLIPKYNYGKVILLLEKSWKL